MGVDYGYRGSHRASHLPPPGQHNWRVVGIAACLAVMLAAGFGMLIAGLSDPPTRVTEAKATSLVPPARPAPTRVAATRRPATSQADASPIARLPLRSPVIWDQDKRIYYFCGMRRDGKATIAVTLAMPPMAVPPAELKAAG